MRGLVAATLKTRASVRTILGAAGNEAFERLRIAREIVGYSAGAYKNASLRLLVPRPESRAPIINIFTWY